MTDEKLDQILRQALTPEIMDSEIQIRRKDRKNHMNRKKIAVGGLVACAALALVIAGSVTGVFAPKETAEKAGILVANETRGANLFAITANAAELPEGVASGDVVGLATVEADYGSASYQSGRFSISGQNIAQVSVTTDKCELYTVTSVYPQDPDYEAALNGVENGMEEYEPIFVNDPEDEEHMVDHYEHLKIVGQSWEGAYDEDLRFGMSVPEALWSDAEDLKESFHETTDQVNGGVITVAVTFTDGSMEEHRYQLVTGKIFVPQDENGTLLWDQLTRFLTEEEASGETPYAYGYLMEKID